MNGENKKSKENKKREGNKKYIITSVFAAIVLIGVFLIYNSYSKMQYLQAELKLQEEKSKLEEQEKKDEEKTENIKENIQENVQTDTQKVEKIVDNVISQKTNYEEKLMKRMSSIKDTDFEGSTAEMVEQAAKAHKAWDNELNKIYKLLM